MGVSVHCSETKFNWRVNFKELTGFIQQFKNWAEDRKDLHLYKMKDLHRQKGAETSNFKQLAGYGKVYFLRRIVGAYQAHYITGADQVIAD